MPNIWRAYQSRLQNIQISQAPLCRYGTCRICRDRTVPRDTAVTAPHSLPWLRPPPRQCRVMCNRR